MSSFTESVVEDAALGWLEAIGWHVARGPDIAPDVPGAERVSLESAEHTATTFHFLGQHVHGLFGDRAPLPARKRSFRQIHAGQNFRSATLALLPERQGFLYCVFFALKPAGLDPLADERLLVRRQVYFHALSLEIATGCVNRNERR